MAASSSSSSFSLSSKKKHAVFLSFRGKDTRHGFISHLYDALHRNQIQTYIDDQLERGDEISPALLRAIEESKISLIIFSENYASSTWCLDELVKIRECKERRRQFVVPIFYRIDPSIVRKQTDSFAAAFEEYEERFRDKMDKVNRWRAALKYTAGLSGFHVNKLRRENEFVQEIVERISLQLLSYQSSNSLFEGLIGIEKHIQQVEAALSIGSKDIRIIVLCGMGGIGKTTLASAIYQKLILYYHFEGHCFLENVREKSTRHSLSHLRQKLLTGLFNDPAILFLDTPFVTSAFIRDRYRHKKVLIVLDDVDNPIDVETIIKGEALALGSRIIVTSRDAHVFKKVANNRIYHLKGLDVTESLELLYLNAFGSKPVEEDFAMLSKRVVKYSDGNPLALKVLGGFLNSRSILEWESALEKMEMIPNIDIEKVLRISYEGLDRMEKDIFLDIACFFACPFSNYSRYQVECSYTKAAKIVISVLEDRSLITIDWHTTKISMHNLLQQMGMAIVCGEHKEPGNRSRLWVPKDISHVLETASGTEAIKSISFHLCDIEKDVKVSAAALSKMPNLQYLQIISHPGAKFKLHFPQHGFKFCLSNKLKAFHLPKKTKKNKLIVFWCDFYPSKSLPSDVITENLVDLTLINSKLAKLWNEPQPLEKLKFIELRGSKKLTQVPNLSGAVNIEVICLEGCTSLLQVPSYFKNLDKLWTLNLTDCSSLMDVEGILNKNLRRLSLEGTPLEALPSSIGCLSDLVQLVLRDCKRLQYIPTSICKLKSLELLDLSGCLSLEKFPEILEPMECLNYVRLKGTKIKQVPDSSIQNLTICELDLTLCQTIGFLLNDLRGLRHIYHLDLRRCPGLQTLPPLPHTLLHLDLRYCDNLESIPELPPLLIILDVRHCHKLTSIQELPPTLTSLNAGYCNLLLTVASWKTPLKPESDFFHSCSYRFDYCQNLDQNTRNNIIAHGSLVEILSAARLSGELKDDDGQSILFCYPGNDVPEYFISLDLTVGGASIMIDDLPRNWFDANFLGFAFCLVINTSEGPCKDFDDAQIECYFNFKDDCDVEYPYRAPVKWYLECENLNSDHIFLLYDRALSYKMLQENFGANWSSICNGTITSASFDFILQFYHDGSSCSRARSSCCNRCRNIIKRCGLWLLYEDNVGQQQLKMDVEDPEEEETKRIAQVRTLQSSQ